MKFFCKGKVCDGGESRILVKKARSAGQYFTTLTIMYPDPCGQNFFNVQHINQSLRPPLVPLMAMVANKTALRCLLLWLSNHNENTTINFSLICTYMYK